MTTGDERATAVDPTTDRFWNEVLWSQFGATIETLERAIQACPDEAWGDRVGPHEFWYLAYHTLFFLDYYFCDSFDTFQPPAPFTLGELDPAGVYPDRVYTKAELQRYLEHGRSRCRAAIAALTPEALRRPKKFWAGEFSEAEVLIYQLRHVQHHSAQLNLLLRQRIDSAPLWVRQASQPL